MKPNVFFQIKKVDEAKRLVYARVTDETVDKTSEIFDYATSKPHFEDWSAEVSKASKGKSMGNVRSMHGKIAAGKVVEMIFDDTKKAIDAVIKVTDDNEWNKCLDGTHTGVSIGGSYVGPKWADSVNKTAMRYTAKPIEISLVDRPCNPSSLFFDVQKADGTIVQKAFVEPLPVTGEMIGDEMQRMLGAGALTLPEMLKALKDAELSKVDPGDEEDESEGGKTDGEAAGATEELEATVVVAKADEAAGDPPIEAVPVEKDDAMLPVPKVGNMVNFMFGDSAAQGKITDAVENRATFQVGDMFITVDFKSLAHVPADNGPVTWSMAAVMPSPTMHLYESARELVKLADEAKEAMEKVGARHSVGDMTHLQNAHNSLCALGATCAAGEEKVADVVAGGIAKGLEKRLDDTLIEVERLKTEKADLLTQIEKVSTDFTALEKRLKKVEDEPLPAKGVLMVVGKDGEAEALDAEKNDDPRVIDERFIVRKSDGTVDLVASHFKRLQANHK